MRTKQHTSYTEYVFLTHGAGAVLHCTYETQVRPWCGNTTAAEDFVQKKQRQTCLPDAKPIAQHTTSPSHYSRATLYITLCRCVRLTAESQSSLPAGMMHPRNPAVCTFCAGGAQHTQSDLTIPQMRDAWQLTCAYLSLGSLCNFSDTVILYGQSMQRVGHSGCRNLSSTKKLEVASHHRGHLMFPLLLDPKRWLITCPAVGTSY